LKVVVVAAAPLLQGEAAEGVVEVEEHSQMMEAAVVVEEHSRMMEAVVVVVVVVVVEYSQMMVVEGEGEENPHMQVEGVAKH
jgi:hypothetical protein